MNADEQCRKPDVPSTELLTRLTAIQGALKALQSGQVDLASETGRHTLQEAVSNSDGLHQLVDAMNGSAVVEKLLLQARNIEAVGHLAGGLAHDFNNLLTVITGNSMMLETELDPGDPHREMVSEIVAAADRATVLTGQLLNFSRHQVVRTEMLDVREVVSSSRSLLRRIVGESIEVAGAPPVHSDRPVNVQADRRQLEQVLMNLAGNARDAMPRGGILRLNVSDVTLRQPIAVQGGDTLPAGQYAVVTVTDTGSGMNESTRVCLFEPPLVSQAGTLRGLLTVHDVISGVGGGILVESAPGQGSIFRMYLPMVAATPPKLLPDDSATGTETVLLVEDEPMVRRLIGRLLTQRGYSVLEASDGQEGLDLLRRQGQKVDLLITDVVMPRMSGQALAAEAHSLNPDVRILFMSGYMDNQVPRHGVVPAHVNFVQKPLIAGTFLQKVRDILQAGQ